MEFKVGDKVRILNTKFGNKDKIGTITNISGSVMIYFVEIEGDCGHVCQWSNASDLELVTEEETSMKFKVGDRVRIGVSCMNNNGKEGVISEVDGSSIPYKVTLDDGGTEWKHPGNITKLEETSMKFKVGDKVKVKDSWFGRDGQVGVVFRTDNYEPYNYSVKFDVVVICFVIVNVKHDSDLTVMSKP